MSSSWSIRALETYEEARACVPFQDLVWGHDFGELVPAAILWVVVRNGGILAGAFDGDRLLGFIFGLTGYRNGAPIHWSDMLAVLPGHRGLGIGRALKRYQRDRLLQEGIHHCQWTFDPLEAPNAHLNFNRLGITSGEYLRAAYGISRSPLHRGLPTDRLVADWRVDSLRVRERMDGVTACLAPAPDGTAPDDTAPAERSASEVRAADAAICAPVVNPPGGTLQLGHDEPRVRLLIPSDFHSLDDAAARYWREQTRTAFEAYFGRGYRAMEVAPDERGFHAYLLERPE